MKRKKIKIVMIIILIFLITILSVALLNRNKTMQTSFECSLTI